MARTTPRSADIAHMLDPNAREYIDARFAELEAVLSLQLDHARASARQAGDVLLAEMAATRALLNDIRELTSLSRARVDRLKSLIAQLEEPAQ